MKLPFLLLALAMSAGTTAHAAVWAFTNRTDPTWTTAVNWTPSGGPAIGVTNFPGRANVNATLLYNSPLTTGLGTLTTASPEFGRGLVIANGNNATGALEVASGHLVAFQAIVNEPVLIGAAGGATQGPNDARLTLNGGNLTVIATNFGMVAINYRGTNTTTALLTVENGSTLTVDRISFGGITSGAGQIGAGASGTMNLNSGGSVVVRNIRNVDPADMRATNNFNGGTITVKAVEEGGSPLLGPGLVNNVLAGGLIVDSAGQTGRIHSPLLNGTGGIDGGLTKNGAGAANITIGGSTYTGPTIVNAGSLGVTLPMASSSLTVAAGERIAVTVSNSSWSPATITLQVNTLDFALGQVSGPLPPAILAVGTLNASGANVINITSGASVPTGSPIVLIDYGGNKVGGGTFALGTIAPGMLATLEDDGTRVLLHVTRSVQALTWSAGTGNWGVGTGLFNWNAGSAEYMEYPDGSGDLVRFDDTAGVFGQVAIANDVHPLDITVDIPTAAYTFNGPGRITGATGLTKSGAGILTLTSAHTYDGVTRVSGGGTLQVIATGALGTTVGRTEVSGASTLTIGDGFGTGATISGETAHIRGTGVGGARGALRGAGDAGPNVWDGPVILGEDVSRIGTEDNGSLVVTGSIMEEATNNWVLLLRPGTFGTVTLSGTGHRYGPTRTFGSGDGSGVIKLGAHQALSMLTPICRIAVALALLARAATAQVAVEDSFESGAFAAQWDRADAGVTIRTGVGAHGTARFAALATTENLGARFEDVAPGGARDFLVEFHVRVTNAPGRLFNLHVSTATTAVGSGAPALNLRYEASVWAAYSGTWQTIAGPASLTAGQWHRVRLTAWDWGTPAARYGVELSDAGGTNFTSASATNLVWFQGGAPSANPARYFNFTSDFGASPGFEVDEVTAQVLTPVTPAAPDAIVNISGTYPHLTVFSPEGEIGMGAVVPWADRLWFVTYPPHHPGAGGDKLWTLNSNLVLTARPESVGGTHANRMIHRESQQLVIGPYFIDTNANVRVVPRAALPGRLTGNARHLTDPANQIYFASMEEGFYSVNVNTLAVTTLKPDAQTQGSGAGLLLAGNHGKGLYSGQGRIVYANNGEGGWSVGGDLISGFTSPAGLLAEISGNDFTNDWRTLERKNFTEVTGPGGIHGNTRDTDPLWALGWDKRSVLLKLLDGGAWRTFRLPKGSYTHDSFQGWYTEWPRIREIAEGRLLMHMHGMFYNFPKTFSAANSGGLSPICTYLKMPVDYCWWNGQLVIARDDASTTGGNIWAGQSHSALWFGQLSDLETWGPPAGFGGPWKDDAVTANLPSEPFLVRGFAQRVLHLKHGSASPVNFTLQHDATGAGAWANVTNLSVSANGYAWHLLPPTLDTTWVRLVPGQDAANVTAYFQLANAPRPPAPGLFAAIADAGATNAMSDGLLRPRSGDARALQFAATLLDSTGTASPAYYEIDGSLQLRRTTNAAAESALRTTYSLSNAAFSVDAASVLYVSGTNRFRLPKSSAAYDTAFASGWPRGAREVVTERQLFQAHGTFYELPLNGSGGFRRIRPVTTHGKRISDFASWRGLFAIAGVAAGAATNTHVYRADDGRAALWFGNVDDLWRMGAPRGVGGPWKDTTVGAGAPSDPYLMLGYERKELALSHAGAQPVTFTVEVDFAADNTWSKYGRFTVAPGAVATHVFPAGYNAHWVRLKSDTATRVTATFTYAPAAPQILRASVEPGGHFQFAFTGGVGHAYTVHATEDLTRPAADWQTVTSGVFSASNTLRDYREAIAGPRRFFQISTP